MFLETVIGYTYSPIAATYYKRPISLRIIFGQTRQKVGKSACGPHQMVADLPEGSAILMPVKERVRNSQGHNVLRSLTRECTRARVALSKHSRTEMNAGADP
jgi:hypothetical protein